jgi:hypothetical protein
MLKSHITKLELSCSLMFPEIKRMRDSHTSQTDQSVGQGSALCHNPYVLQFLQILPAHQVLVAQALTLATWEIEIWRIKQAGSSRDPISTKAGCNGTHLSSQAT